MAMTAAPETGFSMFSTTPAMVPVVTPWAASGADGISRARTARTAMTGGPSHSGTFDSFIDNSKRISRADQIGRPSVPTGCNGDLTTAGSDVVRLRIVLKSRGRRPCSGTTALWGSVEENTEMG